MAEDHGSSLTRLHGVGCGIGAPKVAGSSVGRKIFRATITVGLLTFLVRVADTGKYLVIAKEFGTSDALDAFFMAMLVPAFLVNVVAGSLNSAFMPMYIQVREHQGEREAREFLSNIMSLTIGLFFVICFFLGIAGFKIYPLLASGFDLQKLRQTVNLFYWLLPVVFLGSIINLAISAINAEERFAVTAISPISIPLSILMTIIIAKSILGIYTLVLGTLGGSLIQAGILFWKMQNMNLLGQLHWPRINSQVIQVARQYGPMIGGALLMGSTDLIDNSMAAMLGPGSVSVLNYSNKVVAFIIGVGAVALGTAVFPQFSRLSSKGDWRQLNQISKRYGLLVFGACVPLTILLIIYSEELVRVIFQRGAFTASDTRIVSRVQSFYLLQIPFYITGMLGVRMLSALKKNHILMIISGINLIANILGNYILMKYMGVPGIGLSTSIVYFMSTGLVFWGVFGYLKKFESRESGDVNNVFPG
ncbi:MAG: polysaccharide biosynthesis C-terminal domain-containing protein [Deltaproteobacteria bacterium]|nr:polysaccharide biosynthesis C-terminal domain-containing protein [Deltaproteobacteria bacterium]